MTAELNSDLACVMSAPKLGAWFPWVSPSRQSRAHPGVIQRLGRVKCLLEVPNAKVDQVRPKGPASFCKKNKKYVICKNNKTQFRSTAEFWVYLFLKGKRKIMTVTLKKYLKIYSKYNSWSLWLGRETFLAIAAWKMLRSKKNSMCFMWQILVPNAPLKNYISLLNNTG